MDYGNKYIDRVYRLNVNKHGERRAPHKPLLLLVAIAKLMRGEKELPFAEVEAMLEPLLVSYAPAVKNRHQPALPYWHLRSDELWEIPGAESFPLQFGGFPQMAALRSSVGHLTEGFAGALVSNPNLVRVIVSILLDEHFPESIHEDIVEAVGLDLPEVDRIGDRPLLTYTKKKRDPKFRQAILRAYEHRCAITGFRAALGGHYLGCEAAHIRWHAYDGPDTVDNGLAIEPTLHKLFDAGAWTITDDRRVLVSKELTGTDATVERIRSLHGEPIRPPIAGELPLSVEYIRWHRESDLGGVFRSPALPL
ncbi:MAG: putative restriction endonuclease [Candidatus Latescibacterota bacterium]|jgi:putative restriction endonuclease